MWNEKKNNNDKKYKKVTKVNLLSLFDGKFNTTVGSSQASPTRWLTITGHRERNSDFEMVTLSDPYLETKDLADKHS